VAQQMANELTGRSKPFFEKYFLSLLSPQLFLIAPI